MGVVTSDEAPATDTGLRIELGQFGQLVGVAFDGDDGRIDRDGRDLEAGRRRPDDDRRHGQRSDSGGR